MASLQECTIFSHIDLVRAFHKITVKPADIHNSAMTTPFDLFEFTRVPVGLKNAAQNFQRLIYEVLCCLFFTYSYVDDQLTASHSSKEHFHSMLERLDPHDILINVPTKSVFGYLF